MNDKYQAGQVWKYRGRSQEAASRLVIVEVEHHEKFGTVYHVHIDRLSICTFIGTIQDQIDHLPVTVEFLNNSVTEVDDSRRFVDIKNFIKEWREQVKSRLRGVFSNSAIDVIESLTSEGQGGLSLRL